MIEIHLGSIAIGIFLGVLGTIAFTAIYLVNTEDDDDTLGEDEG